MLPSLLMAPRTMFWLRCCRGRRGTPPPPRHHLAGRAPQPPRQQAAREAGAGSQSSRSSPLDLLLREYSPSAGLPASLPLQRPSRRLPSSTFPRGVCILASRYPPNPPAPVEMPASPSACLPPRAQAVRFASSWHRPALVAARVASILRGLPVCGPSPAACPDACLPPAALVWRLSTSFDAWRPRWTRVSQPKLPGGCSRC